jgi:hypothetical protein
VNSEETTAAVPAEEQTESAEATIPTPPDDLRARLLARFEHWLDQTLAGEPPPRGVPDYLLDQATATVSSDAPAGETDLYTLFSSLTALTGEIRLQGRAFKQLTDLLTPLVETPTTLARLEAAVDSAFSEKTSDDPGVSHDQVCAVMIDLFDRLQRGLQTCDNGIQSLTARAGDGGWLRRLLQNPADDSAAVASVQAIRDASALTLARLSAALQEWGVQRIGQTGEPFDPNRMSAVDVRTVDDVPPGTVLLVQRSGYAVNGIVKAIAQVTVSKG